MVTLIKTQEDARKFYREVYDFLYSHDFDDEKYIYHLYRDTTGTLIVDISKDDKVIFSQRVISSQYIWNDRKAINRALLEREDKK